MAVTVPSALAVVPKASVYSAPMAKEPLHQALKNVNYLWQYHRPPLISAVYTVAAAVTRSCIYHIPVKPSAESGGIRYVFEHRFVCSAATQTVTVSVDYCTTYAGGATVWTSIYSGAVVTGGAGSLTTSVSAASTIPDTAVAIRVTYTAPASGTRTDHHLLVYPAPSSVPAAAYTTGYEPYDDGILAAAGAPIHEEWLQRCGGSSAVVLTDRRQCAFAFVQEYTTNPYFSAELSTGCEGGFRSLPTVRGYIPNAKLEPTDMTVSVIAAVDSGATADLVSLAGQTFAAAGGIDELDVTITPKGTGLETYVDWTLGVKANTGKKTRVFAAVAWWVPTAPTGDIVQWIDELWPVALTGYLGEAISRVESVALGPYVGTAHLFDGVSSGLTTRYFAAVIPPGLLRCRATVAQTSISGTPAVFADTVVTSATGGVVDTTIPYYASTGTLDWLSIDTTSALVTCDAVDLLADGNGTVAVTLANAPYTEALSVQYAAGVSVWAWRQLEDMEDLP